MGYGQSDYNHIFGENLFEHHHDHNHSNDCHNKVCHKHRWTSHLHHTIKWDACSFVGSNLASVLSCTPWTVSEMACLQGEQHGLFRTKLERDGSASRQAYTVVVI